MAYGQDYIVFETATGRIIRTGHALATHVGIQALEGQSVMSGEANDALHYIVNGEVVDRPALSEPVGLIWPNVPAGSNLFVNDEPMGTTLVAEALELVSEDGRPFTVRIEPPFPYRRQTWRISQGQVE